MHRVVFSFAALTAASSVLAQQTVPLPAAEAYAKAIEQVVELGFVPTFRDAELLLIKTDALPLRLDAEQADCGSMFGFDYISDKRVKTAVSHTIRVKPVDAGSSTVTVTTKIDGYMDVNEGAPFFIEKTRDSNKVLNCKSTGRLETDFINSVAPFTP